MTHCFLFFFIADAIDLLIAIDLCVKLILRNNKIWFTHNRIHDSFTLNCFKSLYYSSFILSITESENECKLGKVVRGEVRTYQTTPATRLVQSWAGHMTRNSNVHCCCDWNRGTVELWFTSIVQLKPSFVTMFPKLKLQISALKPLRLVSSTSDWQRLMLYSSFQIILSLL